MAGGVQAGRLSIEIVAEIARLQQDLDKAKRAVAAASGDIAKSARAANDNLGRMGKGAEGMGQSSRLAGHHVQNLTFQLNDMIVGLASGQKPMTVFMQQGMQIGQIMQMAGVGVGGFIKQLGLLLVPFAPIIAAAGALAAGLALVTHEVDQNSKMHITWQDVVLGTYDAVVASLNGAMTGALKSYGTTSGAVFKSVWEYAKTAFNLIYGIGTMVPRVIAESWSLLPGAVGEAAVAAANAAIRAMNSLMKAAVDVVNGYVGKINAAIAVVNSITGSGFGMLPTLTAPQVAEVANRFAGAGVKFGAAMGKAVTDTFNRDFVGEAAKFIQPYAEARARKRLAEVGGKGGKDAGAAAGKAAGDAFAESDELVKGIEKGFNDAFGQSMKNITAMLEAATAVDYQAVLDDIKRSNEAVVKAARDEGEARARNNTELQKTVDYLDQLVGLDGGMGKIFKALKEGFYEVYRDIGKAFGGLRDVISNVLASLGTNLKQIGAGAAIGGVAGGVVGSGTGGSIGGAIGTAIGTKALSGALGTFAGPLGAIAGGLLGGIIGGLFNSTPKASATVSIIAGNAVVDAVKGNSGKLKAVASGMANSLIDSLSSIADQLGVSLGTASISVGQRGKKFVVDPTGAGRTKGPGVLNFGKDQAAALEEATRIAISQGVFDGLSDGFKSMLSTGDLQKQLTKVLGVQGVLDEAAKNADGQGFEIAQLDKWLAAMTKDFAEAGQDIATLEAVYGKRRADIVAQYAEEASTALEEAAARAAEIAGQRHELELQLMEATGRAAEAKAMRDADAIAALDPSLQDLQRQLFAAQKASADAALQQEALATATALAEQAARDAAEAMADAFAKVQSMVDQRRALTIQIAQLLNPLAAQEMERADALRATDPANRALLQQYWDISDATARAAAAEKDLADAREAAAKLAEQRRALEIGLADIVNPAMAEAMRRADQLASLTDPISRGLQEQIYAAIDAKAAEAELVAAREQAAQATNDLRNQMLDAYKREADGLQGIIDKMGGFAASIAQFRNGLLGQTNPALAIGMTGKAFASTRSLAQFGDEGALGRFTGDAQAYLDAAKGGTEAQYRKALGEVLRGSNAAIGGASSLASNAQQQLDRLNAMFGEQANTTHAVETFASLYGQWQTSLANETIPAVTETVSAGLETVAQAVTTTGQSTEARLAIVENALVGIAGNIASISASLRTAQRGGGALAVTFDGDAQPVEVVA